MPYHELIKNFDKIRSYMREFYVYGFKSRSEFDAKSARSYDDERRRIESWLGGYMRFTHTAEGKNVFLSVDNRVTQHNPFYKAWKAKSFTDKDITLHFILFDILHTPEIKLTLQELIDRIDRDYLSAFETPMAFDESTVRKKLKEYADEELIVCEKQGRQVLYSRAATIPLAGLCDLLDYFSEAAPCGVIGSYLLDQLVLEAKLEEKPEPTPTANLAAKPATKPGVNPAARTEANLEVKPGATPAANLTVNPAAKPEAAPAAYLAANPAANTPENPAINPEKEEDIFSFKHHYITGALDSEVLAALFCAMREKRYILAENFGRHARASQQRRLVPLRVYSSVQSGRQHLLAYSEEKNQLYAYRLDYLKNVRLDAVCERFDALRQKLDALEPYMWGVNCRWSTKHLEHVSFTVRVGYGEEHIVRRLKREKCCGAVEQIDETHYRFSADVFDTTELVPWIRTLTGRITQLDFSNRTVENILRQDLEEMYRMYGIGEEAAP